MWVLNVVLLRGCIVARYIFIVYHYCYVSVSMVTDYVIINLTMSEDIKKLSNKKEIETIIRQKFSLYCQKYWLLFDMNLIVINRDILIICILISTNPHLNIVSSGRVEDLVKLLRTRSLTTSLFKKPILLAFPEKISCVELMLSVIVWVPRFTVVTANKRLNSLCSSLSIDYCK